MADQDTTATIAAPGTETAPQPTAETPANDAKEAAQDPKDLELAALRADKAKLENDLKAVKGERQKRTALEDELKGIRETIKVLAQSRAKDDEELPERLAAIENQQRQVQQTRGFEAVQSKFYDNLMRVNGGDAPLLDVNKAPELASVREAWAAAVQARDPVALAEAHSDAVTIIAEVERKRHKADTERARKEAEAAAKKALREGGALDHDTGGGGGGGSESYESLVKKPTGDMTYQQILEHDKKLDAALKQKLKGH